MADKYIIGKNELAFLSLLRAAVHGGKADLPAGTEWQAVFQIADRQHVLPLILDAAWLSGSLPEEIAGSRRIEALRLITFQARRTYAFLNLYRTLTDAGCFPLVLKGLVCRALYPDPDSRPSGDEDLLIEPAAFSSLHSALTGCGLQCEFAEPSADLPEITYTGPDLRIELHLSPFPEDAAAYGDCSRFFKDSQKRSVSIDISGAAIRTLSPSDHLLYLLCHAYKHFLHSGVGIRQICDIALFSDYYGKEIDWTGIFENCRSIRIDRFAGALFRIASVYLGFPVPEKFNFPDIDEKDLLADILSGGVYGAAEDDARQHSSTLTLEAVASQKRGRKSKGPLAAVFLPLADMVPKYPYLSNKPWLLPAAWVQRVINYSKNKNTLSDSAASMRIARERISLLKEYGILD